eukprot:7572157-Pyramimonas_sp.AAC.1
MQEVQEERRFRLLLAKMRNEVASEDRIQDRVPFFQVQPPIWSTPNPPYSHPTPVLSAPRVTDNVRAQCFVAKDLVNFMCRELGIRNRNEASAAAAQWMERGVFYHVSKSEPFADGGGLYRFKEDEVDALLNMK